MHCIRASPSCMRQARRPPSQQHHVKTSTHSKAPKRYLVVANSTSVDVYVADLHKCEETGDWLKAVELLTEVRVLKIELPDATVEAGLRTLVNGQQHQRAADLSLAMLQRGWRPSDATLAPLFSAIAASQPPQQCVQLLAHVTAGRSGAGVSAAHNVVVTTLARAGAVEAALALLDELVGSERVVLQTATFNSVASACLKAGLGDKAEELLEMRDYL